MTSKRPGKEKDTTLTPLAIIKALGTFDFDPCGHPSNPTAEYLNIWPSDGLTFMWWGRVWCNPPYSDPSKWLDRMAIHNDGVALVLASTDTVWFQKAVKSARWLLFMKGRPFFLKEDGSRVQLMRATVLIEWGGDSLVSCGIEGFLSPGAAIRHTPSAETPA